MVRWVCTIAITLALVASYGGPGRASREHVNEQNVPWGGLLVVCTSEPVLVTGTTHVNTTITIDERKGGLTARVMTKSRGTGIGTLGSYTAQGNDHVWGKIDPDGNEELHLVLDVKLNGKGITRSAPSHFYVRLKMTFPAGGGAPVVQHEDTGCR